jgi:exodeoxyribonuclease VII large subunit
MYDSKLNPLLANKTDEIYISVSWLAQQIKNTLEVDFNHIRVKGEVVQPKQYQSGLYFTLREGMHSLDCVVWKDVKVAQITEGLELICTGKLTTYSGRSKYQLNVYKVEPFGIGILLKTIEERRNRLLQEGLFDPAKKPPIPKLPKHIGLITSKTGAVLQDMLHRLRDRYPVRVTLYPIQVQGNESPGQAINGIRYLIPRVDLIILARGGGSFEDLLGFNDEALVRTVASSPIPIVTGIGHETDTTLVDYAATLRAPTPTAAIELATPVLSELFRLNLELTKRIKSLVLHRLENGYLQLSKFKLDKESFLRFLSQKLDYVLHDLQSSITSYISYKKQRIRLDPGLLQGPLYRSHRAIQKVQLESDKVLKEFIYKKQLGLEKIYNSIPREYTITDGINPVKTKEAAIKAKTLVIYFPDGIVHVKIIQDQ